MDSSVFTSLWEAGISFNLPYFTGILALFTLLLGFITLALWGPFNSSHHGETPTQALPADTRDDAELARRRAFIRRMALSAFHAYEKYAWTSDALRPVCKVAHTDNFGTGAGFTILAAMSTLKVMQCEDEFTRCQVWVEKSLNLSKVAVPVLVSEMIGDYVGGLLSCYALTGNPVFIKKAESIAQLTAPAFDCKKGLPHKLVIPSSGNRGEHIAYLSDLSAGIVEFPYLAHLTRNGHFQELQEQILRCLDRMPRHRKLYPAIMLSSNPSASLDGGFGVETSFAFESRDFYSGLLKRAIASNGGDRLAWRMYQSAIKAMLAEKIIDTDKNGKTFAQIFLYNSFGKPGTLIHLMGYDTAYLGALFSLTSRTIKEKLKNELLNGLSAWCRLVRWVYWLVGASEWGNDEIETFANLAEQLTASCSEASQATQTKLAPSRIFFTDSPDANHHVLTNNVHIIRRYSHEETFGYNLSSELAESYFIQWRLTHDLKYSEQAWEMAQAIHRHCRTPCGGYTVIEHVNQMPIDKSGDYQSPEFFSATLKYLYLTFCDDTVLPLDQWVFNVKGHPLPIWEKNEKY